MAKVSVKQLSSSSSAALTSYFAQEIPDTVTLNGYARLGMYGNLIELTNNYYISGFRFDKEGKGILCGSDKR